MATYCDYLDMSDTLLDSNRWMDALEPQEMNPEESWAGAGALSTSFDDVLKMQDHVPTHTDAVVSSLPRLKGQTHVAKGDGSYVATTHDEASSTGSREKSEKESVASLLHRIDSWIQNHHYSVNTLLSRQKSDLSNTASRVTQIETDYNDHRDHLQQLESRVATLDLRVTQEKQRLDLQDREPEDHNLNRTKEQLAELETQVRLQDAELKKTYKLRQEVAELVQGLRELERRFKDIYGLQHKMHVCLRRLMSGDIHSRSRSRPRPEPRGRREESARGLGVHLLDTSRIGDTSHGDYGWP